MNFCLTIAAFALSTGSNAGAVAGSQAGTAASAEPLVVVVPIEGKLSEGLVAMTVRALRDARRQHAVAVVFDIDTETGNAALMDRIVGAIEELENVPTIAYVRDSALGPGAVIAITCERLYMKGGSRIGDGLPSSSSLFPLQGDLSDTQRRELISQVGKLIQSKAERSGRNTAIAKAMVDPTIELLEIVLDNSTRIVTDMELAQIEEVDQVQEKRVLHQKGEVLTLTAQEAADLQFIDALVPSLDEALSMLDLGTARRQVVSPSWSEAFAEFIHRYGWLFLAVGLIALFLELKLPGFGIPGIVGISCLSLLLLGKYLAGLAEIAEILLIAVGILLILIEVFAFPGMTLPGVIGALCIVFGLVMSFQQTLWPGDGPAWAVAAWWANTRMVASSIVGAVFLMIVVSHFLPQIPFLGRIALRAVNSRALVAPSHQIHEPAWLPELGAVGICRTPLKPVGKAEFGRQQVEAVAEGQFIEAGCSVVVVRIEGRRIVVAERETT